MDNKNMAKEIKYQGKFLRMINEDSWEYVERVNCSGVVGIIAVNNDNKVVLVEQFRKAIGSNLIEFPAGLVGDTDTEEKMEVAANRELEEETGYSAEKMTYLFDSPVSAGLTVETISFMYAQNIKKVSEGGGVESENITVHEVDINKINFWLKQKQKEGIMVDSKVFAGLYLIQNIKDFLE